MPEEPGNWNGKYHVTWLSAMAEGGQSSTESSWEALVSFEDWKRPVTFSGCHSDTSHVVKIIKQAFPEIPEGQVCRLQIKSQMWGGQYVDLPEGTMIPDRSNVRVILVELDGSRGAQVY